MELLLGPDPLGPRLLLPDGAVAALAAGGPPVAARVAIFPLGGHVAAEPPVDAHHSRQERDGANAALALRDEHEFGYERRPLALALDAHEE
eukprot:5931458-Pyramimonas_sp.AAC.1